MLNDNTPEVFSLKDLVALNVVSIPFFWQDYIPKQGFGILTGPSDSSKSTFVRQLAFSTAQKNTQFLGKALNPIKGKVLIIASEDGKISTAAIVRKQNAHLLSEEVQENIRFMFRSIRNIQHLDEILTDFPVDLVIIDTWTDSFREDINSSIKVRENLEAFNDIAEKHDCFILGIHHNRKSGDPNQAHKQNVLGSMAIEAVSRVVIDLRPCDDNKRKITIVKGNYISDNLKMKPVYLDLNPESLHLSLSLIQQNGTEGRISKEKKEEYMVIINDLKIKRVSNANIERFLKEKYPNENTPSKTTIHNWLNEAGNSQSQ